MCRRERVLFFDNQVPFAAWVWALNENCPSEHDPSKHHLPAIFRLPAALTLWAMENERALHG